MFYLIFTRNLFVWNDYEMISHYDCNNFNDKKATKIHCNCSITPTTNITFKVTPWLCLTWLPFCILMHRNKLNWLSIDTFWTRKIAVRNTFQEMPTVAKRKVNTHCVWLMTLSFTCFAIVWPSHWPPWPAVWKWNWRGQCKLQMTKGYVANWGWQEHKRTF